MGSQFPINNHIFRVLVIEESLTIASVCQQSLIQESFACDIATNEEEGIEKI